MASAKSGKHIYVSGTGNTLASVASDINDPAYCTWDAGTKTLTVFGTAANIRYFRIRANGVLTINAGETLQFSNATVDDTRLYVDAGSHLIMNDDAEINGSLNTVRPQYWYFYGRITCNANIPAGLRPTFKNFYRMLCYETANNNAYPNDIWDFTGAFIGGGRINNGIAFYIYPLGKTRGHIFKDMIFDEAQDSNLDTFAFNILYGINAEPITFENINFERVERAFQCSSGALIHTKNCTVNNQSNSWGALHYGCSVPSSRDFLRRYGNHNIKPYGQHFTYHEGLTFLTGNNANKMNVSYGGVVLIKDCDFQRTSGDAIECKYQGRVLEWTGNAYADAAPYDIQQGGERSVVYRFQPTILDENGDPIESAVVHIEQHDSKESFTFTTGDDGMLNAMWDLKGAMLTHESYYTNTAKQTWSSSAAPHRYSVFVDGYATATGALVMDQDRALTINMLPATSTGPVAIEDFSQDAKVSL